MNKTELALAIVEKTDVTKKQALAVIDAFTATVKDEVAKGEKVQLVGFGTFESVQKSARECRNPQTGKTVKVAAKTAPKFKAGKDFKEAVNSKASKKTKKK